MTQSTKYNLSNFYFIILYYTMKYYVIAFLFLFSMCEQNDKLTKEDINIVKG